VALNYTLMFVKDIYCAFQRITACVNRAVVRTDVQRPAPWEGELDPKRIITV